MKKILMFVLFCTVTIQAQMNMNEVIAYIQNHDTRIIALEAGASFDTLAVSGGVSIGGDVVEITNGNLDILNTNGTNPDQPILLVERRGGANWWGAGGFNNYIDSTNDDVSKSPYSLYANTFYAPSTGDRGEQGVGGFGCKTTSTLTGDFSLGNTNPLSYPYEGLFSGFFAVSYSDAQTANCAVSSGVISWFNVGGAGTDTTDTWYGFFASGNRWGGSRVVNNWYSYYSQPFNFGATQYHFYGLGDYPSYFGGDIQSQGAYNFATDTSTAAQPDIYDLVYSPFVSYSASTVAAGTQISWIATTANTGAANILLNALAQKDLLKMHDQELASGDIEVGQVVTAIYDGTAWQMTSQIAQ